MIRKPSNLKWAACILAALLLSLVATACGLAGIVIASPMPLAGLAFVLLSACGYVVAVACAMRAERY